MKQGSKKDMFLRELPFRTEIYNESASSEADVYGHGLHDYIK